MIEQRVRSSVSGFDEVTSTNESYEKIVVDHPERFADDVIEIAKARLADREGACILPDCGHWSDDGQDRERRTMRTSVEL